MGERNSNFIGGREISDDEILEALGDRGARTERVADRFGYLRMRPQIYRRLVRLEKAGRVKRVEQYTASNSIFWMRVPTEPPHV